MSKHTVSTEGGAIAAETHKTRRAALRALAGASALAVPVIAASSFMLPDPIFAAIERHKAAYEACEATSFAIDDLERFQLNPDHIRMRRRNLHIRSA